LSSAGVVNWTLRANNDAASDFTIYQDSTPRLKIDSSGNLGIGTSSPNASFKLDVAGKMRTAPSSGAAELSIRSPSGSSNYISWAEAGVADRAAIGFANGSGNLQFRMGGYDMATGTQAMTLDSSGNLGLGVTPSAVSGFLANKLLEIGGASSPAVIFRPSGSTSEHTIGGAGDGLVLGATGAATASNNAIRFFTSNTNSSNTPTERARISSDGTFRVKGAGTAGSTDAVQFSGSAPASAMTLDASGNLGLGNTNPASYGGFVTQLASGIALHSNSTSGAAGLNLYENGTGRFSLRTLNGSAGLSFYDTFNGTERARITSGGYFKASDAGTYQNAAAAYHELRQTASDWIGYFVNTNATPYGIQFGHITDANSTGSPFFQCTAGAALGTLRAEIRSNGGLANYSANDVNLSDRREKTNFAPAKSYLDTICAIPVQTFNYIDQWEDDPGLTLGVVAQDVQAVAPELVMESNWGTEDEPKMRLSIYQTDLQYALMKCVQELKAELDSVKAELATLKGQP
jgi:hypothetical protein